MDVQIEYTFGAFDTDGVSYLRNFRPDADIAAIIAAVDVSRLEAARADDFTICDDQTAVVSPGQITRTFIMTLTADFESRFPTEDLQRRSLTNLFKHALEQRTPFPKILFESFTFGDPLCP